MLPEQQLQQVQGAAGLKPVGVGRDAAHRVHRHRPADEAVVTAAGPVGPRRLDHDLLGEGGVGQLGGQPADRRRGDTGAGGNRVRCVLRIEVALGHELEHRHCRATVGQRVGAGQRRRDVGRQGADNGLVLLIPGERAVGVVAREQAVARAAGLAAHQPGRIRVADQVVEVDLARGQQRVDQGQDQKPVRTRPDADPFVGDRRIAGAHRIDRDELCVAGGLQLAEADLERVGIVVLGDAEHQQIARVLPVRLAEFPERATDRVEAGGGHVDGAEAAMGGIVGRAELARPIAGQGLALVAAGEEGEAARVGLANSAQPFRRRRQRLVPLDLGKLAAAARADPLERLAQPCRRIVVHDAGRTLGTQDAAVDRVVAVAFDVADGAVAQVHLDAAAAGAHVAGRVLDVVADRRRGVDDLSPASGGGAGPWPARW